MFLQVKNNSSFIRWQTLLYNKTAPVSRNCWLFTSQIGDDLPGYRNHIYWTVTYVMYFLGNKAELERLVETAFVYHDIALWTNRALAYLEPSEEIAQCEIRRGLGS